MASMQVLAFCHPGYSSYRRIKQPIDKIARGAKIRWPRNRAANALAIPVVTFLVVPLALAGIVVPVDLLWQVAHAIFAWMMVPLTWLANELSRAGIGLDAGQMISTGTLTGMLAPKAGETYVADFGPFGSVTVVLT